MKRTIVLVIFIAAIVSANAEDLYTYVVENPDSAAIITASTAWYGESITHGLWDAAGVEDAISVRVDVQNKADIKIKSFAFNAVFFTDFDEHLRTFRLFSDHKIKPSKTATFLTFTADFYADFEAYSAILYISAIRFDDGSVWKPDDNFILEKVNEIKEATFTEAVLELSEE